MSHIPADPGIELSAADREALLAELLEQIVERTRQGESPDLERAVRAHPDLAVELRELWATAMIAEDLGSAGPVERGRAPASGGRDGSVAVRHAAAAVPQRIGDYELLEELGRGGMGVVFKARQASLGRIVALKMILRGELASASDVARFRAEAESAARLNHPHIVPVYEVGEHERQPFFTMQYVEGTTLARRIAEGPLPPREAARLLLPVCRAIAEAHRHGLLHRDLKPSNILIDRGGRPFVSDFGLAKQVRTAVEKGSGLFCAEHPPGRSGKRVPTPFPPQESGLFCADPASGRSGKKLPAPFSDARTALTQSGAILGTPAYMAPEQAAGRRGAISPATDVYSLGALLYAMLTGRAPFQAASPVDTVLMVLEQDPLPPRMLNHRADPDLEMIALKCLQKPADLRYNDAAALADDLEAYLAGEPVSARSSRFSQILSRAFRESHHAAVLENWGLLWMWHSLVLLVLCFVTSGLEWRGVESRLPYLGLWGIGLGVWAAIFWNLRRRSGPVTFVERQIAHVWAGSVIASTLLYALEWLLDLDVLALSPVLGLISGMVFLVKAGILAGGFYLQAAALFVTAGIMALLRQTEVPPVAIALFGIVSAACFFFPGLKYHRQRLQAGKETGE